MLPGLFLLIVFLASLYLFAYRPQQRANAEHREMVESLVAGDHVVGYSGIHGVLVAVHDTTVEMEIAPGVVITMALLAVAKKLDDDEQDDLVQQVSNPETADDASVTADGDLS